MPKKYNEFDRDGNKLLVIRFSKLVIYHSLKSEQTLFPGNIPDFFVISSQFEKRKINYFETTQLDFGDNYTQFRCTDKFFTYKTGGIGSIMLPFSKNVIWSLNADEVLKCRTFVESQRNNGKKVMVIAKGISRYTIPYDVLSQNNQNWVFNLLGFDRIEHTFENMFFATHRIEFEDLHNHVDFFISSCNEQCLISSQYTYWGQIL